eukprot:TRINITY_DN24886_c0_g1_i1.p1 TRINITY_DN24886_c0_g1~~TRINITY_DN24886_c0_g1_i1.p1  ORF type:complete len:464 (+),score=106.62 TRINITY_DN24886_c0_g1_i1:149-1393(+)
MVLNGWTIDMATGDASHFSFKSHQFIDAIVTANLRPTVPASAPPDIANIIQDCLAHDPDDRPHLNEIISDIGESLQNPEELLSPAVSPRDANEQIDSWQRATEPVEAEISTPNPTSKIDILYNATEAANAQCLCIAFVDETVWVGCADGKIYLFDLKTGKIIIKIEGPPRPLYSLCIVNQKHVWAGADSSISVYKRKKRQRKPRTLKGHIGKVISIVSLQEEVMKEKSSHMTWSSDNEGYLLLWKGETRIKKLTIDPITNICLTPAKEGHNVWIGTKKNILYVYDAQSLNLRQKFNFEGEHEVYVIGDNVWISGERGHLKVVNKDSFVIINELNFGVGLQRIVEVNTDNISTAGQIWIGDCQGSIFIIDKQTNELLKRIGINTEEICAFLALPQHSQVWSVGPEKKVRRWFFPK